MVGHKNKDKLQTAKPRIINGKAAVTKRAKSVGRNLPTNQIVVINFEDLDMYGAEAILSNKPKAVVNAARSITGRYPNLGPRLLLQAGIPLIDDCGGAVIDIRDSSNLILDEDGTISADGEYIATGKWIEEAYLEQVMDTAGHGMILQLKTFAANTLEYVEQEAEIILEGKGIPRINTQFSGRHTLLISRGYNIKPLLKELKPYIKNFKPLIVGIDNGADAALEAGIKLDLVVASLDQVSDNVLRSGAELVARCNYDGTMPGVARAEEFGVVPVPFVFSGNSEDIALILADNLGSDLLVSISGSSSIYEFLDKGRQGMSSTFITRLKVANKLLDASSVRFLYQPSGAWFVFLLVVVSICCMIVALATTNAGHLLWQQIIELFNNQSY